MTEISIKDRDILRSLAARQRELAESERNAEILKQWNALGAGRREAPTVRLLFSNLHREIIRPQMKCEGEEARRLEEQLLKNLAGRVLFDDDTPLSPTYDLQWAVEVDPFALTYEKKKDPVSGGYHIEPQIKDLGSEYEKLIGEIMEQIHLSLDGSENYGKPLTESYLPGYYLQKSALYTRKENEEVEEHTDEVC